jgi:hypothetical protein
VKEAGGGRGDGRIGRIGGEEAEPQVGATEVAGEEVGARHEATVSKLTFAWQRIRQPRRGRSGAAADGRRPPPGRVGSRFALGRMGR